MSQYPGGQQPYYPPPGGYQPPSGPPPQGYYPPPPPPNQHGAPQYYPPPGGPPPYGAPPPPQGYHQPQVYAPPPPPPVTHHASYSHAPPPPHQPQYGYAPPPPVAYGAPVVAGHGPHPETDAKAIYSAVKGIGTDEKALTAIIATKTPAQIASIAEAYRRLYGSQLCDRLRKETSFNFGAAITAVTTNPYLYDCELIYKACADAGTDESLLTEVLIRRSNYDIANIKQMYQSVYQRNLEQLIKSELSGKLEKLFVFLLMGNREDDSIPPNPAVVAADVDALYKAGTGRMGTDETAFIRILTSHNDAHLRYVFASYNQRYGRTFLRVIEKEFSGDLEHSLKHLVLAVEDPAGHQARQLEKSMEGLGTKDADLVRRVVRVWMRGPQFLQEVKNAYQRDYRRSLQSRIEGETSGDYKRFLSSLVGP